MLTNSNMSEKASKLMKSSPSASDVKLSRPDTGFRQKDNADNGSRSGAVPLAETMRPKVNFVAAFYPKNYLILRSFLRRRQTNLQFESKVTNVSADLNHKWRIYYFAHL